jgi:transmembrane sensor
MTTPVFSPSSADSADAAATEWFIRRDRGLAEGERVAFEQWLQSNHDHAAAMARVEKVWSALDPVFARPVATGIWPDPDMLAPPPRRRFRVWLPWVATAAAAAAAGFLFLPRASQLPPSIVRPRVIVHPAPEKLVLEDGSTVELNGSAKVDVEFTPTERRVRLLTGEAYFTVAKNPQRPFIVSADRIAVRAIGTAFSVERVTQRREISVLVTDGHVGVTELSPGVTGSAAAPHDLAALVAGQKGIVSFTTSPGEAERAGMKVTSLSPAQIERALSWQGLRLEFYDVSLGEIVMAFNRYSQRKLVVHDGATAAIRVGGTCRADNIDDFVRLLGVGFGVAAFPHGEEIILRKTTAR